MGKMELRVRRRRMTTVRLQILILIQRWRGSYQKGRGRRIVVKGNHQGRGSRILIKMAQIRILVREKRGRSKKRKSMKRGSDDSEDEDEGRSKRRKKKRRKRDESSDEEDEGRWHSRKSRKEKRRRSHRHSDDSDFDVLGFWWADKQKSRRAVSLSDSDASRGFG
ncbi:hypothetical protein CFOL_v3_21738 [Cephalotus follicularis]|uniref:Uncharacterized protein n=1 Tax=Cephalotus follicularis TaxID=3775 RepID=A0A1Q3CDG8_CEPFO|nr:hypothetical protein CFOL_v3_21738 [Cephalotus follicularis]